MSGFRPRHATGGGSKEEQRGQKMIWAVFRACLAATFMLTFGDMPIAKAEETVIVAFGDSLSAGFGLPEKQSFAAVLERALKARGRDVKVVNAGVSGDTAQAGLARLDWAIPDNASAVILELGANDALQGLQPSATRRALEEIIKRVQGRGLPILLAGMEAPPNMGRDYVATFHAIYPDLAAKYGLVLYPFFLDGVALEEGAMQDDGMHPNAKGLERIVEGITPKVEELLARVQK
jgi:acyl-CoA thioesterase-1